MARTYKNARKMRIEGRLHSNDMTENEKIRWLIDYKNSLVKEFNSLPKILELAKDYEIPRKIIINDLTAITNYLQQLKQNPNIHCNNCKDISARNLLSVVLGEII